MLNLDNSEFNDSDFFAEKIKANQEFMDFCSFPFKIDQFFPAKLTTR